jgi:zinc transport system substrate-binding protein
MIRLLLITLCLLPLAANAEALRVVVSVKPLHSLVAAVMEGAGEPQLLLRGGESPHTYTLRPSDARALQRADLVVWVGPDLEAFLEKPLTTLAPTAQILQTLELPDMLVLRSRSGGTWETAGEAKHDHDHHGSDDTHVWLDPSNAAVMARAVADRLAVADPPRAGQYQANAAKLQTALQALDRELEKQLEPVRERPYVVFHDAYQYLEYRYRLNAVGSVTLSPERSPGARRISELRGKIQRLGAVCVFQEPQFEAALVQALIAGTQARAGVLDPVGVDLPAGPEAYFVLMRRMADNLVECLASP